jgi:uncharacterized protein YcnI
MIAHSSRGRSWAGGALRIAGIAIALTLVVRTLALAHAVVFPKTSATGSFERYYIRVPNEKKIATTRVEIQFPSDVRVTAFEDVPGWTLEVARDTAQRIVGAVWTGTLAPERFAEFPFQAANPKTATEIHWPVFQTYADGERVEWTGAAGSKRPASTTVIAAAAAAGSPAGGSTQGIAIAALALSIVSLGLVLRRSRTA